MSETAAYHDCFVALCVHIYTKQRIEIVKKNSNFNLLILWQQIVGFQIVKENSIF